MSASQDKNIKRIRNILKLQKQSVNQIQPTTSTTQKPPAQSVSTPQNVVNYGSPIDSFQQYQLEQIKQALMLQSGSFFPTTSNGLPDNSPQLQRSMLPNFNDITKFSRTMPPSAASFNQFQMLNCPPVNQLQPQNDQVLMNLLSLQSLKSNNYLLNPSTNQLNSMMLQNNNLGSQLGVPLSNSPNGQMPQFQFAQDQNQQQLEEFKLKMKSAGSNNSMNDKIKKDWESDNDSQIRSKREKSRLNLRSSQGRQGSQTNVNIQNPNKKKILQSKQRGVKDEKEERLEDQQDLLFNVITDEQAMGIYKRLNAVGTNAQRQSKLRGDRRVKRNWHHSETQLLYWVIKSYSKTQKVESKDLTMADWQKISQFVPGRNANQCQYKWQSNHKPKSTKAPWNAEQDSRLKLIVTEKGAKSWAEISRLLNFQKIGPIRQGKQCRQRWFNHVNPAIKWLSWTEWEDITLLQKQQSMGNKWSQIAKCIPGRTQNSVKNRFNSLAKKERTKLQQQNKAKNNTKADNASDLKNSMNSYFKVKKSQGSHQTWIKPLLASLLSQYKAKYNSDYDANNCPEIELQWQHSDQIKDMMMDNGEDKLEIDEQGVEENDDDEDEDPEVDDDLDYDDDDNDDEYGQQDKNKQREQNKRAMTKRIKKEKQTKQDL